MPDPQDYLHIMELREDYEDTSPTVAVVWIFLGLKCPNIWQQADHYLRDLKTMITAEANFDGLRFGNFLELEEFNKENTASNTSILRGSSPKPKEIVVRDSRWGVLCEAMRGDSITREQMFQARIIAELAKAVVKKDLPWEDLKGTLSKVFPPSLR